MKYEAYWISPRGSIVPVEHRHIETIAQNPSMFGLTRRKVLAAFRKHGEPVGFEGFARGEIMTVLIRKGWTRIRYRRREDSFTVELYKYNSGARRRLRNWAGFAAREPGGVPETSEFLIAETRHNGRTWSLEPWDMLKWSAA